MLGPRPGVINAMANKTHMVSPVTEFTITCKRKKTHKLMNIEIKVTISELKEIEGAGVVNGWGSK